MAQKGAWAADSTYSAADVTEIIQYAKTRGVRVVPEIDTPGHAYSWGASHPDIVVNCPKKVASTYVLTMGGRLCFDYGGDFI